MMTCILYTLAHSVSQSVWMMSQGSFLIALRTICILLTWNRILIGKEDIRINMFVMICSR